MKTGQVRTTQDSAARSQVRQIEGRHNPLLKELRAAFGHSELTEDGCIAIEGLKIVEEAIRSGLRFRAVFFGHSAEGIEKRLLPQMGSQVEKISLPDKLFSGAVPTESPQGVAALVKWKEHSQEELLARSETGPILVIAGLQDPGNLGTILRSAEAFGAAGVVLGEGTVSVFNSKVIRASAGSVFRLPLIRGKIKEISGVLRAEGIKFMATSSHRGVPLSQVNLADKHAFLIGNEGAGIPRDLMSEIDETVAIPHSSQVESLNAGIAASILLYESARQRNSFSPKLIAD
jgi:TrmH family RNA methyltransferase